MEEMEDHHHIETREIPSTQQIPTYNSHIHNTTPPFRHWSKPSTQSPPTPPTTPQPKHRPNTPPVPTGLVKPKPKPLIHSNPSPHIPPRPPRPNQTHTHFTHTFHQLLSSHAPHQSLARQLRLTQYMDHVYHPNTMPCTHHNHTSTAPHHSISVTLTLSHHTHIQHKQQYMYHSHRNHRIHIGYRDNLTDRQSTTT